MNELSQTSQDHDLKKMNAAMNGLVGCLVSSRDVIVLEREESQQGTEKVCKEMDRKFAEHVLHVEREISFWEKRVTKGNNLLENLSIVIEEVKGKLANSAAYENGKENGEARKSWEVCHISLPCCFAWSVLH